MASRDGVDARVGQMVSLYAAIIGSVPTELERARKGAPLTEAEIPKAAAYMDRLADRIQRERAEQGDT